VVHSLPISFPSSLTWAFWTTCFNNKKLDNLPTESIYGFHVILKIINYYILK
jgi:hypothetical protein